MATKTKPKTVTGLNPLQDRLIVRPDEAEQTTDTGIILPDSAREKPMRGEVLAAGPGRPNEQGEPMPLAVKKGDKVVYGKFSGTNIEFEGEDLVILREPELLAKVED